MKFICTKDYKAMSRKAANIISAQVIMKPASVLGLATGSSPIGTYDQLVAWYQKDDLDFAQIHTVNLDEYVGLPPDNPCSYRHYMNHHLFDRVNIDKRNTRVPDGMAADLDAACREYEEAIGKAGGIDLQLLGIGRDGHIGFNEPLSALRSRTRVKSLTDTTVAENCTLFQDPKSMPRRAITMGVGTILESRRIIMLVTGKAKAEVLAAAVEGPITAMISASAIQLHPACTVVVDEAAASRLKGVDYYRWIFANEPEWEEFR